LRKIWTFDGGGNLPSEQAIKAVLPHIGWQKVHYDKNSITLPAGMEIDFGGIGKEYAVDRVAGLLKKAEPHVSIVVNFGGDLAVTTAKPNNGAWTIGIESPGKADSNKEKAKVAITIKQGALATSGDARRFLLKDGKRYSHILNPKTGWPIVNAPRSVTVAAPQCIQAGILSTVALLQGDDAEAFLAVQGVNFWCFK
ncbi:MAG: FAD:protein FMN transferase, partial [Algicola sp.]|nr:FAD:protein FMN transferase [Algicola sp.]